MCRNDQTILVTCGTIFDDIICRRAQHSATFVGVALPLSLHLSQNISKHQS